MPGAYRGGVRPYGRTAGSRRDLSRRLNQLAAGVTLRYVAEWSGTCRGRYRAKAPGATSQYTARCAAPRCPLWAATAGGQSHGLRLAMMRPGPTPAAGAALWVAPSAQTLHRRHG